MRRALLLCWLALTGCDPAVRSTASATRTQAVCGEATDETVRIMRGLAPSCEGCHVTGARAFFASVSSFQNLIVADPRLVAPGDPDHSEFVRLLEDRGTGAFTRMPIGTRSYGDLLTAGTATLPIADVRQWIAGLVTQARDARPDPAAPRITRIKPEQVQRALYQQLGLGYADYFIDASDFGVVHAESRSDDLYPLQPDDAYLSPRNSAPSERFHGLGGGTVVGQQKADLSITPTFVLTLTQVSQRWCRLGYLKANNVALFPAGTTKAADEANVRATITRWFLHFHGTRATAADVESMYAAVWTPLAPSGAEAGFVGLCSAFIRHPDWIFY